MNNHFNILWNVPNFLSTRKLPCRPKIVIINISITGTSSSNSFSKLASWFISYSFLTQKLYSLDTSTRLCCSACKISEFMPCGGWDNKPSTGKYLWRKCCSHLYTSNISIKLYFIWFVLTAPKGEDAMRRNRLPLIK